jgi:beta-phosphoglucomutase-like phosphatase (HAD superfamily)
MIGLIFDCDGTLVDTEHLKFLALHHALQTHGIGFELQEYFFLVGKSHKDIKVILEKEKGVTIPESLFLEKDTLYQEMRTGKVDLIEATVAFARACISRKEELGVKVALATADIRKNLDKNLLALKLDFDAVVCAEDVAHIQDPEGVLKPKPYLYLEAAKRLGIPPQSCISFEDTMVGVHSALNAGCLSVAIPNEFTKYQNLSQADMVIESLEGTTPEAFLDEIRGLL